MTETDREYRVYSILQREETEPYWFQIGRAFPHKDQEGGFTIRLNALPISPKLVIRVFDPEDQTGDVIGSQVKADKAEKPAGTKTKASPPTTAKA